MRTLHCPTYFSWTPGGLWVDFAGVQMEFRWILLTLDAGSNKNIKEIEILLKRNWSFTYHIFIKEIERNI